MGKKDITLNAFLGDAHIFADLMNGCCRYLRLSYIMEGMSGQFPQNCMIWWIFTEKPEGYGARYLIIRYG